MYASVCHGHIFDFCCVIYLISRRRVFQQKILMSEASKILLFAPFDSIYAPEWKICIFLFVLIASILHTQLKILKLRLNEYGGHFNSIIMQQAASIWVQFLLTIPLCWRVWGWVNLHNISEFLVINPFYFDNISSNYLVK